MAGSLCVEKVDLGSRILQILKDEQRNNQLLARSSYRPSSQCALQKLVEYVVESRYQNPDYVDVVSKAMEGLESRDQVSTILEKIKDSPSAVQGFLLSVVRRIDFQSNDEGLVEAMQVLDQDSFYALQRKYASHAWTKNYAIEVFTEHLTDLAKQEADPEKIRKIAEILMQDDVHDLMSGSPYINIGSRTVYHFAEKSQDNELTALMCRSLSSLGGDLELVYSYISNLTIENNLGQIRNFFEVLGNKRLHDVLHKAGRFGMNGQNIDMDRTFHVLVRAFESGDVDKTIEAVREGWTYIK